jgi:hypothetical protein
MMRATPCGELKWRKVKNLNLIFMKLLSNIKAVTIVIILCCLIAEANAQYRTAIGVRLGGTSGFTIKHQIMRPLYLEGILGTFGDGFSITGLLEKNTGFINAKGLYLYYGGGPHIAFYNGTEVYNSRFGRNIKYHTDNDVGVGVNLILGLEYKLRTLPLAFSLDLKPFLEFGSGGYLDFAPDPGFGLKFTFPK